MRPSKITALTALGLLALTGCTATDQAADPASTPAGPVITSTQEGNQGTGQAVTGIQGPATALLPSANPAAPITDEELVTAILLLPTLQVAHQDSSGYNRTEHFGKAWEDVDGNGCDTRNDILARDLTNATTDNRCRVLTGTLADPYTGTTIDFKRGKDTSDKVQIDHIIALNEAWGSGAKNWTQEQRVAFANDPANLMAVDGPQNTSKSAKDAAQWAVPENPNFTCTYLARQVILKAHYQLSVDKAEYAALERGLAAC